MKNNIFSIKHNLKVYNKYKSSMTYYAYIQPIFQVKHDVDLLLIVKT